MVAEEIEDTGLVLIIMTAATDAIDMDREIGMDLVTGMDQEIDMDQGTESLVGMTGTSAKAFIYFTMYLENYEVFSNAFSACFDSKSSRWKRALTSGLLSILQEELRTTLCL